MQQLFYFLRKYKYFLYFMLLQIIAFLLIINNHSFHKSKFVNSSNVVTGGFYKQKSKIQSYLNLKTKNKSLVEENLVLKNKLVRFQHILNDLNIKTGTDSTSYEQQFNYVSGRIYKNEFHKSYNFLTINRGKKHGVFPEMAVINNKGIIGITDVASGNYTRVRSILNRGSKINARLKNTSYFGFLSWNGKDYNIVQLIDIPRQAKINVGDTIITGGNSAIFPKGILIGTVIDYNNLINVKLFNDMANIENVYIIQNFHKKEIKYLDSITNE